MIGKSAVLTALLGATLFCGGAFAQGQPMQNISGKRHPNLAAAQRLTDQAYAKVMAAQQANEFDMDGQGRRSCTFSEDSFPKWYFVQRFGSKGNPL